MTGSGSGSHQPDPDLSSANIESLRRRLYLKGGDSPEALAAYLSAVRAAKSRHEGGTVDRAESDGPVVVEPRDATTTQSQGAWRRWVAVGGSLILAIVVVAIYLQQIWTTVPDSIAPPPVKAGTTLLYFSRMSNPQSFPNKVTFDPADYTLYRADGHRISIEFRCIGRGTVRITIAELPFYFHCGDQMRQTAQETKGFVHGPFLILGRTTGNPVWSMRITSVPLAPIS